MARTLSGGDAAHQDAGAATPVSKAVPRPSTWGLVVTPKQYLDVLRARWRTVVAALILGLATAAVVTALTPRAYTADAVIFVSARTGTDLATAVDGSDLSAQRMATYVEVLRSQKIAQQVGADPGVGLTAAEVADRISVSTVSGTLLLTTTVTDGSPTRAAQIANLAAARFVDSVAELERPADPTAAPLVKAEVFASAVPDPDPVAPSLTLNLAVGAALGLLVGFGLALLHHSPDPAVTTRPQLDEVLRKPVLGEIGFDPKMRKSPLVMFGAPTAQPAESFRKLRTNVRYVDAEGGPKVVLVASPARADGRTAVVCNLGIATAEADLRVLLIDADLREPDIATKMLVAGDVGLADVLTGRASADEAIQASGPGLDVLPGGATPQNPSELLGSERMSRLLDEVRGSYDLVLIDSPPLLPVADAAVLARRVDGVLLAVRHGGSTVQQLRASQDALDAVGARVVGSVLTMVPAERASRGPLRRRAASSTETETETQRESPSHPQPVGNAGHPAAPGGDGPPTRVPPMPPDRSTPEPFRPGDQARR